MNPLITSWANALDLKVPTRVQQEEDEERRRLAEQEEHRMEAADKEAEKRRRKKDCPQHGGGDQSLVSDGERSGRKLNPEVSAFFDKLKHVVASTTNKNNDRSREARSDPKVGTSEAQVEKLLRRAVDDNEPEVFVNILHRYVTGEVGNKTPGGLGKNKKKLPHPKKLVFTNKKRVEWIPVFSQVAIWSPCIKVSRTLKVWKRSPVMEKMEKILRK